MLFVRFQCEVSDEVDQGAQVQHAACRSGDAAEGGQAGKNAARHDFMLADFLVVVDENPFILRTGRSCQGHCLQAAALLVEQCFRSDSAESFPFRPPGVGIMGRRAADGPQDEFPGGVGEQHFPELGDRRNAFHQLPGSDLLHHFRKNLRVCVRRRFRPPDFRSRRGGIFLRRESMKGCRYFPWPRVVQPECINIKGGAGIRRFR